MGTLYRDKGFSKTLRPGGQINQCANASVYTALRDLHIVVRKYYKRV